MSSPTMNEGWIVYINMIEYYMLITTRTKAITNVLDKIRILIEDDKLIIGNVAAKPMGEAISR